MADCPPLFTTGNFLTDGESSFKTPYKLESVLGWRNTEGRWCVQQMLRRTTGDTSGKSVAFPDDALGGNRAQRGGAPFATMAPRRRTDHGRYAHAPFRSWQHVWCAFLHIASKVVLDY